MSGELTLYGRSGSSTLTGQAAWVACGGPGGILIREFFRYDLRITLGQLPRKILSFLTLTLAAVMFFGSIFVK